jgi:hypothetical protein
LATSTIIIDWCRLGVIVKAHALHHPSKAIIGGTTILKRHGAYTLEIAMA